MTERYTVYELARMAGAASPDSTTSAGAKFLESVADATIEAIDDGRSGSDLAAEIADDAPDVYTHTMWLEFVDLAAYSEDPSDLGADASDMESCARTCLYMIAVRLVDAICGDYQPDIDAE